MSSETSQVESKLESLSIETSIEDKFTIDSVFNERVQSQLSRPDLLLPVIHTDDNHKHVFDNLMDALMLAFDVPKEATTTRYEFGNRDLLWVPDVSVNFNCNYYQLASFESSERHPVKSILSYLFDKSEPYYNDPYDFSEKEKADRKLFYNHLKSKYKDAETYIQRVKIFLFQNEEDQELDSYILCIQRRIFDEKVSK